MIIKSIMWPFWMACVCVSVTSWSSVWCSWLIIPAFHAGRKVLGTCLSENKGFSAALETSVLHPADQLVALPGRRLEKSLGIQLLCIARREENWLFIMAVNSKTGWFSASSAGPHSQLHNQTLCDTAIEGLDVIKDSQWLREIIWMV